MSTTTNIKITSYVDCISDETLAELLPMADRSVTLRHIARPYWWGHGAWRLSADLEIDGKRITLTATTHDEDLKIHFVDQSEWNRVTEPTMTEGEAAENILSILFAANEDELMGDEDEA